MTSMACGPFGRSILIFTSRRPGRRIAGSIRSSRLEAPITITFLRVSTPSISASSCGTIVDSMSEEMPGAAGAEDRVHLVEEHDDGQALLAALLGPDEDLADLPLGLAHVLVQELGALDVEEVAARVVATRALGHLLGQRLRDRLGDQRLAAPGRAVEQDALGRLELVLVEQLGVQERQLDRVADQVDLALEPADVLVADVGDLLEDEFLDLLARQLLGHDDRSRVEQRGVAGAQPRSAGVRRPGRRRARRRPGPARSRGPHRGDP